LLPYCALAALFNANEPADQPKCDPATRVAIIDDIEKWIVSDDLDTSMLWLYGPAGAGKTALAKTIAEIYKTCGRLLGTFFFSRTKAGRSSGATLVPTLAYQLMLSLPSTRSYILKNVKEDPGIFQQDMATQFERLLIHPLNKFMWVLVYKTKDLLGWKQPRLFVIDGLDECFESDIQCKIIQTISDSMRIFRLPIRFIITSRPEAHINRVMAKINAPLHLKQINLAEDPDANRDIRTFLCNQFEEIRKIHPEAVSSSWPTSFDIDKLVQKASGQFIYAKAVVDYLKTEHHRPAERLEVVLLLSPAPSDDSPFAHLDQLYHHIFSSARNREATMEVVSLLVLPRTTEHALSIHYTSPVMLEQLLMLKPGEVRCRLVSLPSLLTITGPEDPIKVLHASLPDHLFDQSRSGEFFVDHDKARNTLRQSYLQVISKCQSTCPFPNVLKTLPISSIAQFLPPDVLWRGLLLPALTHCAHQDLFALLNAIIERLYVNRLSFCPWEVGIADVVLDELRRHARAVVG